MTRPLTPFTGFCLMLAAALLSAWPAAASPAGNGAASGAYQGYSGGSYKAPQDAQEPVPPPPSPSSNDVALPTAPSAPVTPAPAQAEAAPTAAPAPAPDECAAYAANPSAHAVCADRMQKIKRMRDAATQRDDDLKAYYNRLEKKTQAQQQAQQGQEQPKQIPGTNVTVTPTVPQASGTVNLTPSAK
jgi:hypothetical protein